MIASLLVDGLYFISEEKLLRFSYIPPLEQIGFEGLFGLFFSILLLLPLNFIHCKLT